MIKMLHQYRHIIKKIVEIGSIRLCNIVVLIFVNYIIVKNLDVYHSAQYYLLIGAVGVASAFLRFGLNTVFIHNAAEIKINQKDHGIFLSCTLISILIAIFIILIFGRNAIPNTQISISIAIIISITKNINLFASELFRIFDRQILATVSLDLIQNLMILGGMLYLIEFGILELDKLLTVLVFSSIFAVFVNFILIKRYIEFSLGLLKKIDFNMFGISYVYSASLVQALTDFFVTQLLFIHFSASLATTYGFCGRILAVVSLTKQSLTQLYSTKLRIAITEDNMIMFQSHTRELYYLAKISAFFLLVLLCIVFVIPVDLLKIELDNNLLFIMSVIAVINLYIGPIGTVYLVMSKEKEMFIHVLSCAAAGWIMLGSSFWFESYDTTVMSLSLILLLSGAFISMRISMVRTN